MHRIGIMAAMHDEIAGLLKQMESVTIRSIGMRDYHAGLLHGQPCVAVLARIGKVAAAATAVTLIREFGIERIVFTGLAGGVAGHVRVGDVVIGTSLLQHDMDASPIFPRHEIPLLGHSRIGADPALSAMVEQSTRAYLDHDWRREISPATQEAFCLSDPRVHSGLIVSGDQFVSRAAAAQSLRDELPDALCVEMEGAAVAQICHEYGVRFAVVRTISDRADDTAVHDFNGFLAGVASHYSAGILRRVMTALETGTAA
ncbi:5'-methylthioadenosine/adenosylhomocysteine nucleosidase [Alcaligenaceae bacterium]|nr:5'-methylthioadenosine/adenosylhomocysteine nucleosidase [Alcaligenaceae bacterium]